MALMVSRTHNWSASQAQIDMHLFLLLTRGATALLDVVVLTWVLASSVPGCPRNSNKSGGCVGSAQLRNSEGGRDTAHLKDREVS
jgi:hypothetical protein